MTTKTIDPAQLNASFMRSLCLGQIEEDMITPFPKISDNEKDLLHGVFDTIKQTYKDRDADFRKWDRAGEMPEADLQQMRELGLFSLVIPEEHGGLGMSSSAYSRTVQELSKYDGSVALTAGAHSSIGMRGLLLFGTPEQKAKYMPKLASGETIAAFALTEPGAGSDAASIKTRAVKDGSEWVINGEKLWITNGGIGGFYTVFARTDGPEGQITAFIVTRDMPGVSTGPHEDKMGLRASNTTTLILENVRVPEANILGEVGKGFKVAMKILNSGRTGLGGGCVGGMKRMIELAAKQSKMRTQFGKPISDYGLIKQKIGHMVVETYASESVVNLVSGLIDQGYQDYAVEAAISKVYSTEVLWKTIDESLQIAGGNGFMCEFPYERALRDSRVNRIFEGTNDILRLFIALTAMNDVGKQLKELSDSLKGIFNDPIKGFGVMSEYARKQVALNTGFTSLKNEKFTKINPALKEYTTAYEEMTRELSKATDRILRKHGKGIIGKQFATKRLADIMIDLFVLAATLGRVNEEIKTRGLGNCTKDIEILHVLTGQVKRRVRSNLSKIDDNDDDFIKSLADHALEAEHYTWDNV